MWPEQQGQPFVLAVTRQEPLLGMLGARLAQTRADAIAATIPRRRDWARVRLARPQLTEVERRWDHRQLVRRSISDASKLASCVVFAASGTALARRWHGVGNLGTRGEDALAH